MNYKKKNKILLAGSILLLIFIYKFSITNTLNYKKKCWELMIERELIDNSALKLNNLKRQSIYLDSVLQKENISVNNSFQQILLKRVNDFKKEKTIELVEFSNTLNVKDNGIKTQLYPITLKGNFNELLSFLNHIEQQGLGEIKNFKFIKKKNYKTRKEYLQLELYLKKITFFE